MQMYIVYSAYMLKNESVQAMSDYNIWRTQNGYNENT